MAKLSLLKILLALLAIATVATLSFLHFERLSLSSNENDAPSHQSSHRALQENSWLFPRYPQGGPVIATLVSNSEKDIEELSTALKSLVFLRGDDPQFPAPVLIFNEGDLADHQIQLLERSTDRPIAFPLVDFGQFPDGWNHNTDATMFRVKGRKEWGYYQMIRFWVTGIWKHPALEPYETVMRIDSDSCFKEGNDYLPNFKNPNIVYHSQYVGFEDGKEYTTNLLDFTINYLERIQRNPGNPFMWHFIKSTWEAHQTLPVFMTNFEVSRKSFMLRPDVMAWHEALTESEPFGIFRYRWGDAVTRFLTAAIFTTNEKVMTARPVGYGHKLQCDKEEVEAALSTMNG